jgi:hypothetical protein
MGLASVALRCGGVDEYVPNEYSMICTHYTTMQTNSFSFAICTM